MMRKIRCMTTLPVGPMAWVLMSLLTIFGAHPALADAWGINQLMRSLAQNKGSGATFVEKKFIAVLDAPVESSGDLIYRAPDHLEKITRRPKFETLILDREVLTIVRGAKTHTLPLQNYPEISAVVGSIRGTLAGDRALLEQTYHLTLEGDEARWILTLDPAAGEFVAIVRKIRIFGVAGVVNSIEMLQADGDRSVMSIESVKTP
jgi:outer membrane lipoprotein-sorting protein